MTKRSSGWALTLLAMLAACGAVEVPEDFTYRLPAPEPRLVAGASAGTLRVAELDVVAELAGDRLLIADEGTRLRAYRHHHWAGPLERMVADAIVTGLVRSRRFAEVKSPSSSGLEELVLVGRVLDFHQVRAEDGWRARATFELRLSREDGTLVFQDELRADTPMSVSDPDTLARALGTSVGTIVDEFVQRCDRAGLFATARPPR
ncbi:MAG: membrane integrity-associated transporter subunit PqiC [Planctomycetes bacterium]|nr:membrane integrity-associated transporter subunit PqiC [Planctomycetota bacterium]